MFEQLILSGIFISLLAGQFARIELFNGQMNLYVQEFLLLAFIIVSGLQFGIVPIKNFFRSRSVLAFFSLLLFSFFFSLFGFTFVQNVLSFLYLGRLILYSLFGMYLFNYIKRQKKRGIYLYNLIYNFSILLLLATIIQYVFYPNFWVLKPLGWDPHMFRASAAYFDIYVAAAAYGMLAFYWFSKKQYLLSFLFIGALALSFSRSAYIAFALSLTYFFIAQKKWKEILIALSFFVILIVFIPKPFGEGVNLLRTSSITSRVLDYKLGLKIWQEKPLFGFGYNRIRYAKEQLKLAVMDDRSHSLAAFHSSFLIILTTMGIVGFMSFLFLVGLCFKKHPRLRIYIIYILSMSLFDNVLLHVLVMLPLICIAASLTYSSFE